MEVQPTGFSPRRPPGERLVAAVPYLWLIAFFLAPFLIVLKIKCPGLNPGTRKRRTAILQNARIGLTLRINLLPGDAIYAAI